MCKTIRKISIPCYAFGIFRDASEGCSLVLALVPTPSKPTASEPAGESSSAAGQQTGEGSSEGSSPENCILVLNDRDRRTLAWLRSQVSNEAIAAAIEQLAVARRPFVSNVVKALGLSVPEGMDRSTREEALRHLAAIRAKLKSGSR